MANPQTPTFAQELTELAIPFEMLTAIQRAYIDWKALDGIITDDDGVHELTLQGLGEMLRPDRPIDKSTLSKSCKNVPNFWDLVTERRKLFNNTSRLAYVHKKWYIKAATVTNWPVTEAWLINHDKNYVTPKVKVEHSADDSWLNLVANKSKDVIEGEVVDGPKDNA
jgi:hypothetical protein